MRRKRYNNLDGSNGGQALRRQRYTSRGWRCYALQWSFVESHVCSHCYRCVVYRGNAAGFYRSADSECGRAGRSVTVKIRPLFNKQMRNVRTPRLLSSLAHCGAPTFNGEDHQPCEPAFTLSSSRLVVHGLSSLLYLLILVLFPSGPQLSEARTLTIVNSCPSTVWPGTLSNAGQPSLVKGGFVLAPGARQEITAPVGWAGRFWGRTGCKFDATNAGTCETGDCGRGLYCDGAGGIPPATLAEFTLDGYGSQDFYDVSLVDGYNVPLAIVASGGSGVCGNPGCVSDLNRNCPAQLQVVINGTVVSCKSACEAFQSDVYCCSGSYNSPSICGPTEYSQTFKKACPTAYSYAYDDASSTYTCTGAQYEIVFCPDGTSGGGDVSYPAPPPNTSFEPPGSPGTLTPSPSWEPPISPGIITPPPPPLITGLIPSPSSSPLPPPVGSTFPPPPPSQTAPSPRAAFPPQSLNVPPPPTTIISIAGNTPQFNQPGTAGGTRSEASWQQFLNLPITLGLGYIIVLFM
ncbi:hypothetical protein R1flu_017436 [Riccia fluitans]|uniref:Thaumatin-like protein n=1 Tax=Riccia fluitans TaxID=41844 RepID=A0ABD1ZDA1_9MARC